MNTPWYRSIRNIHRRTKMHHLRHFGLVLMLTLLLPGLVRPLSAASATSTLDMAAIDRYVSEQLRTLRIPGAALGIVHGGQIVHLQGFGRADSSDRPMTTQTPLLIGSLTKSFTAVAIMQLVEQGTIELDSPVQRYLPWFRVADPAASAQITVRHLLNHSSGLPSGDEIAVLSREDTSADAIEQQVRALATVELMQPVGSVVKYANTGYMTLGLVVETVSGQSYEDYVQEHIFAPLQMQQSFTSPHEARRFGLAEGHQYLFGQPRPFQLPYPRGALPAGYLVSSAEDMSRYLLAHLNGGQVGNVRILSTESVAELHRPSISMGDDSSWIGMDWGVFDVDGVRLLQHDGDTGNYHSDVYLFPETGWGFVLLMNASNPLQRSATRQLGQGVATLLMGQQPQPVAWNPAGSLLLGTLVTVGGLLLLSIARSIQTLRRWHAAPPRRAIWRQIVLPLMGNALVALLCLVLVPTLLLKVPLPAIIFQIPDLGYTLAIIGGLALGWGLLRTVLALHLLPRQGAIVRHVVAAQS